MFRRSTSRICKQIAHGCGVAGAGIDVTTAEPPKKNHPYYQIIKNSNFVWTPHTAWASEEALQASMDQLILNINEFYLGKPRNLVIK